MNASNERTIAFVDLAGFTALTDVHGDHAALDLVDAFTDSARAAIDDLEAELVKAIGDAVMIAAQSPSAGLEAVRRLFEAAYTRDGFPEPRAGLHHGTVIERDGDYFGATVNLAARVASRASSGQTLATASVLDAARSADIDVTHLGVAELRNVLQPVELWAIELCPTHIDISVDPVCRMRLSCQAAVGRVRHRGIEYRFCSLPCVEAFARQPDQYLDAASR